MSSDQKSEYNHNYKVFSQFVLRTPLLPFPEWGKFDSDYLHLMLEQDLILKALYLASPGFYSIVLKYKRGEIIDPKKKERIEISLMKYLARMSVRCTPFGFFAKCNIGTGGPYTNLVLSGPIIPRIKPDAFVVEKMIHSLLWEKQWSDSILFFPNTSLYSVDNKWRYTAINNTDSGRQYSIKEIVGSDILQEILTFAQTGKCKAEFIQLLTKKGYSEEDSTLYIEKVIKSEILMDEFQDHIVGKPISEELEYSMENIPDTCDEIRSACSFLQKISHLNQKENTVGHFSDVSEYISIAKYAKEQGYIENENDDVFQVDLHDQTPNVTINSKILRDLEEGIRVLTRLTPSYENKNIKEFKKSFFRRYEDKEVCLLEVFDPELGISYAEKDIFTEDDRLLSGLVMPPTSVSNKENLFEFTLNDLLMDNIQSNNTLNHPLEIILTDSFVNQFDSQNEYPEAMNVLAEIRRHHSEYRIYIKSIGGSTPIDLISRFTQDDPEMERLAIQMLRQIPEDDGKIKAEIVHSSGGRVNNVIKRAHLRDYEILYLGNSSLSRENVILGSDLFLSLRNNRFVLRSKKLNKIISPVLSNAHDYNQYKHLSVYRFLCDLQFETKNPAIYFNWENLTKKRKGFLPQVRYKNCIFSLPMWRIELQEIKEIVKKTGHSNVIFQEKISLWMESKNMAQIVQCLHDGINFVWDWKNLLLVKALLKEVGKKGTILVTEYFFDRESCIVKDKFSNSYTNEFVFGIYKE